MAWPVVSNQKTGVLQKTILLDKVSMLGCFVHTQTQRTTQGDGSTILTIGKVYLTSSVKKSRQQRGSELANFAERLLTASN
jgi:hypothetical protein